jgi:hypothetical protein
MPSEISDYIFVDDPTNNKVYAIRLVSGPYVDTIYKYANIKINEDTEKEMCTLSYAYNIMSTSSSYDKETLHSDADFKNYIGDVLSDILSNQEYKIGNHGE